MLCVGQNRMVETRVSRDRLRGNYSTFSRRQYSFVGAMTLETMKQFKIHLGHGIRKTWIHIVLRP